MTESIRRQDFKELPVQDQVKFILRERMPKPEQLVFEPTIEFLDPSRNLSREELGKVIAMGDRTAISYKKLMTQVIEDRNKPDVEIEGETVSATSAFYLQYALAARSGSEIAHSSILEQVNPGPSEFGGDSPIIFEGVSILAALRDVCALDHFGFEAFSSRGALFPENYRRIPKELRETPIGEELKVLNDVVYDNYLEFTREALAYYLKNSAPRDGEKMWQWRWRVLNLALDDSRQLTNGTFLNHFAMHPNSSLSLREAVVELSSSEVPEVVEIANKLRKLGEAGLPTLMRYTEPSAFTQSLASKRASLINSLHINNSDKLKTQPGFPALFAARVTHNADKLFLASFLSRARNVSFPYSLHETDTLSDGEVNEALAKIFEGITLHDKAPEELKIIQVEAHLKTDVGAIFDLLRHRPVLHLISDFTINNGYTIPDSFRKLGLEEKYQNAIRVNERMYERVSKLGERYERVFAPYFVARAHLQDLSMIIDGREAFHLLKIRADEHAHPNVRVPMEQLLKYCRASAQVFNFMPTKR